MTTENNFTESSLGNFSWDNLDVNMGEIIAEDDSTTIEQPIEQEEKNKLEEPQKEDISIKKEKEENLEEVDLNKPQIKKDESKVETSIYDDVYKDLKDYGILKHVEIEDNERLSPEKLKELYEKEYEEEVNSRINDFVERDLNEEGKNLIKYIRSGGKVSDFVEYYNKTEIPEGNIEDENFQDELIRYQLKKQDYDHDEIEDFIENLTNSGKKEQRAKKIYERLSSERDRQRDKLIYEQEETKKAKIREFNSFKESVKSTLTDNKEIEGFKINEKEKDDLFNFIVNANVPNGNTYTTGIIDKINKVFKDPNKLVLLAKILKSDFDFKDLKKKVETETTNKVKSNLENRKGLVNSSVGSSTNKINLSEIFS